jgi:hypothetical protein
MADKGGQQSSLFRVAAVSAHQKTTVVNMQRRWQLYRVVTWAVCAAGVWFSVVETEYPGEHILRPVQHGVKTLREAFVTGDLSRISFSPPPLPPELQVRYGPAPVFAKPPPPRAPMQ